MGLQDTPHTLSLTLFKRFTYVPVSSASFLLYDYLLTLRDEVRLVWSAPWGFGKVLFLLTRYSPFMDLVVGVYRNLSQLPTTTTCEVLSTIGGWTCVAGLAIAEVIMLIRVWAMWNQSRLIGIGLAALAIACIVVSAAMYAVFGTTIDPAPNLSALPGCHYTINSKASFISFLLLMSFEILMMILTLVKGIQDLAYHHSSFLYKFYQDGVLYYATLSIVSLLNVVMLLTGPPEFATIFISPQRNLHSILSARILLRLREDACRRQDVITFTEPVGSSIFVRTGAGSQTSSWWRRENARSWFGDANSNVAGSNPHDEGYID